MKAKFCPRCNSTQIILVAGGEIGMFECANCGFRSSIFPEKDINEKEENGKKQTSNKR